MLALLGADREVVRRKVRPSISSAAVAVIGGAVGSALSGAHPVLGFLGGATVAGNAYGLARGDRTWKQAAERVGRHVVAAAGSLALPSHPVIGWCAGALAADLLMDEDDGGIIDEWVHHFKAREGERVEADALPLRRTNKPAALEAAPERKAA